jgi:alkylation response protein AidB-like acyl-CoA dehydrogenase
LLADRHVQLDGARLLVDDAATAIDDGRADAKRTRARRTLFGSPARQLDALASHLFASQA